MSSFTEKMYGAGVLVGVLLICFNVFWSSLASNPSYSGNYTNVNANPDFAAINASSVQFTTSAQEIQQQLAGMTSPNPGTVILSVLGLVAYTMFLVLKTIIQMPIVLLTIFSSSLHVIGAYIDISVLAGALVMLLIMRAIFGALNDQGISK